MNTTEPMSNGGLPDAGAGVHGPDKAGDGPAVPAAASKPVAPTSRRSSTRSRRSGGVDLAHGVTLCADSICWQLKLGKRNTYHGTLADALKVAAEHLLRKGVAEQEIKTIAELRAAVRAVAQDVVQAWIDGKEARS